MNGVLNVKRITIFNGSHAECIALNETERKLEIRVIIVTQLLYAEIG